MTGVGVGFQIEVDVFLVGPPLHKDNTDNLSSLTSGHNNKHKREKTKKYLGGRIAAKRGQRKDNAVCDGNGIARHPFTVAEHRTKKGRQPTMSAQKHGIMQDKEKKDEYSKQGERKRRGEQSNGHWGDVSAHTWCNRCGHFCWST